MHPLGKQLQLEEEMFVVQRLLGCVALACWLSPAWGQAAVVIESEKSELSPGDSTKVSLYAMFPTTDFAFCCVATDLLSSAGGAGWSDYSIPDTLRSPGASDGTQTTEGIQDIIAGQVYFPPAGPWPDLSNPILIWEGEYIAPRDVGEPFDVNLSTRTAAFEIYFSIDEFGTRSYIDVLMEGEATIRVVPAPASLALLLLGGAAVHRRRR
jgi:hypothetical protein